MTVIPDSIPMTDPYADDPAFDLHIGGKLAIASRVAVADAADLALAYTPGVGRVSQAIADEPERVWKYTGRSNAVAVLSNGTAVLGLGDIGPEAAMPVMEGKAILFKQFGDVDAYPICVNARTVDEVVAIGTALAPTFGGINLEDIKAPECFEIERRLQDALDIPVFHDDQHGTAIVALAALMNAARVVGKPFETLREWRWPNCSTTPASGATGTATSSASTASGSCIATVRLSHRASSGSSTTAISATDAGACTRRCAARTCSSACQGLASSTPGGCPTWRMTRSCSPWRIPRPKSCPN
jgi:hypothetical protein